MTENVRRADEPTEEELGIVVAELRRESRSCASIARRLGWPTLRVSMVLLELWHRGQAEADTSEPFGWRLTT